MMCLVQEHNSVCSLCFWHQDQHLSKGRRVYYDTVGKHFVPVSLLSEVAKRQAQNVSHVSMHTSG